MAYLNKQKTGGDIWMLQGEQDAFTRAWVTLDVKPNLSEEERKIVDDFGRYWFRGDNFKLEHDAYWQFYDLVKKREIDLGYPRRASKTKVAGTDYYTEPKHYNGQDWGSYWPKTKPKGKSDMTFRQIRAEHRCKVRDREQAKLTPEQVGISEHRREIAQLQSQVAKQTAGIEELTSAVIDLQDEIKALKAERIPQYRGAVHHRLA